ncbi:MAG: hypothetical protein OQK55_01925 [Thermoanaerobaculales bacterium]|nr:hypothetical protein [Thermoanaerobaculales bacterium]
MKRNSAFRYQMLVTLAAACLTIVGVHQLPASEDGRATSQAEVANAPSDSSGERYEGYLFLDVDGRPLPFQSDEGIEEYLRAASVVSTSKIPVGVTHPRKVLLNRANLRLNAVFKDIDEEKSMVRDPTATGRGKLYLTWRDSYTYDIAAYRLDRLIGMDRVPPVVARKIKGRQGSLQIWLEGTITENTRHEEAIKPPEIARFNQQRSTMHMFDNLVANRDSNLGNTLIDGNWRLWYIDCGRCFGGSPELLYPEMITHCDRRLWRALKELDRGAADKVLGPYLSGAEIDALFIRRDKLVDLLQARIDEWGEELVLFDQRPPTEMAPWVE